MIKAAPGEELASLAARRDRARLDFLVLLRQGKRTEEKSAAGTPAQRKEGSKAQKIERIEDQKNKNLSKQTVLPNS
ncbi:hypothetical protein D3H65_30715 [Paraflavitalea soli]|uniref:Uncharacterized protein n=1 Tax=Paraflavitalea soli TaxID=2315862 RepID=A0A3B7MYC7_9BACT|nr:hypothetical protein D3H65_30715 [Paraflavitalea soli]